MAWIRNECLRSGVRLMSSATRYRTAGRRPRCGRTGSSVVRWRLLTVADRSTPHPAATIEDPGSTRLRRSARVCSRGAAEWSIRSREVFGGEVACAQPATGRPPSATSAAACSRSRAVTRQRGGMAGSDSVNDLRGHDGSRHSQRRFTHATMTRSWPWATSAGCVVTYSLTRPEAVRHSGHRAAPGSAVTTSTARPPPARASAPATATPASANKAVAASLSSSTGPRFSHDRDLLWHKP